MKRWMPVFALVFIWFLVLSVPLTRGFIGSIADPWPDGMASGTGMVEDGPYYVAEAKIEHYDRILARFPADRKVQLIWAAAGLPDRAEAELDNQASRYPGDVLLLNLRLQTLAARAKDNRNQGYFTRFASPGTPWEPYKPLTAEEKRVVTKMVRLAREGERLEPDNVVYDLYEMYGLFALLRDNEVPAVLRRAALKKTYQDYFLDGVRAQYQVRQLERRLSPQETLGLWRTKSAPHLSQFLRVGRMLMEMVVQARHRGDHKLPLEIGYDLMKVGRRMRLQSPLTDGSWVGTRLEWFAFNYWTERRVGVPFNPAIPAGMANYASVTGHRRVAVEVSNEENIVAKWSSGFRSSFRKLNSIWLTWPSTTPQELIVLKVIEKAGSYLGVAAIFLVPLAALLASWAWYRKARIEDEPRVLGGAFFLGGLTGLIVTAALLGADAAFIWNSRMTANLDKGLAYLDWPGLTWFAWSWIVVLPVSSLVTWPLLLVTRWQKQFKPRRITWKEEMLTVGEGDNFLNTALGYLVPMIGVGTVVLFELGVLGIYCWTRVPEDIVETSGVTALVATTAFTLPFGLRWLTLPRKRLGFSLWIRATSHTIVGYLVTMGICYGLVLLAALPVLADYASQFEALLRYGDVGMIRTLGGF